MAEEREGDEVSEYGSGDDSQEDPGVVGHDAQHQHVAQGDLQDVHRRLDGVQQPPVPAAGSGRRGVGGAERRLGGAALQHGAADTGAGRGRRVRRLGPGQPGAARQPHPPHLQHLVEERQEQNHEDRHHHACRPLHIPEVKQQRDAARRIECHLHVGGLAELLGSTPMDWRISP